MPEEPPKTRATGRKRPPDAAPAAGRKRSETSPRSFPVVAFGASAGGLAALEAFFRAVPADSGAAYVVVMHLSPHQKSMLAELLGRCARVPVREFRQRTALQPDHVYVAPPGRLPTIRHGHLSTHARKDACTQRLPIDGFFEALALDQGPNAVGVVLSGTGSDGTLGLRAIKAAAGMAIAQDDTAKYSGMPQSAIATGLVDFTLPPHEMPACLLRYARHAPRHGPAAPGGRDLALLDAVQKILAVVHTRTGHDFSSYKSSTIVRRIQRRMALHQLATGSDYLRYLMGKPDESRLLFNEFLIGVTSFFRDPGAFEALRTVAQKHLFTPAGEDTHPQRPVRVWVPGCSTGQEAYSVAIVLQECAEALSWQVPIQIFATDIDDGAIDTARAGVYLDDLRAHVSPERIKRFFAIESEGRYRLRKSIRESVVFAQQNVIADPPFSRLDLVCCRNLLIYFSSELQKHLLSLFHYSLRPGGILFLGAAETVGATSALFRPVDRTWKLFASKPRAGNRPAMSQTSRSFGVPMPDRFQTPPLAPSGRSPAYIAQMLQAVLRESGVPPCAVVDEALNLVFLHGRVGRFLEHAEGEISVNILKMARPGLKEALAHCLRKAQRDGAEAGHAGVTFQDDSGASSVDVIARPLAGPGSTDGLLLVMFRTPTAPAVVETADATTESAPLTPEHVAELERQLARTRELLQSASDEHASANEELQSTNEELQSTNEELQSANEELMTSKEELQSLNEEASTVNAELQGRIDELGRANDDLKNLLDSTEIATIFLDIDLRVRRFTPASTSLVPLTGADIGRSITHFSTELVNVDVGSLAATLLDDLVVRELEVVTKDDRNYLLRVRPYRTSRNMIDGVVLTFEDRTVAARARRVMERQLADSTVELGQARQMLDASHGDLAGSAQGDAGAEEDGAGEKAPG